MNKIGQLLKRLHDAGCRPLRRLLGGGAGILVDACRPEQIADAVQQLHNDPAAAAGLSAKALEVARSYAPEAVLGALWERLCEAYPQLVSDGGSGAEPLG